MSYEFWGRNNSLLEGFSRFADRVSLGRKFTYFMIIMAVIAAVVTYKIFSVSGFENVAPSALILILNIDLAVFLILALIVARKISKVWMARKSGRVAAKLHTRFVILSSLLAITPAIAMTIFSALIFNMGLQNWFSDKISTALTESTKVAESYLEEHTKVIEASVYDMARDLAQVFPLLAANPDVFSKTLDQNVEVRNLDEALVFNGDPDIIARSKLSFSLEFEIINSKDLEDASRGVVVRTTERGDRVRALVRISPALDAYLLVGKIIDPSVTRRIQEVKDAVSNYYQLEKDQGRVQLYFMLMFMVVALLLLLIAIWVALIFADRIAGPIGELINASERVRQGDLSVRVNPTSDEDEIAYLMRSYNRMTAQLSDQQEHLVTANKMIDSRRRFIEEVLEGVTSGVLNIDDTYKIQLANQTATQMLSNKFDSIVGADIKVVFPESFEVLETLCHSESKRVSTTLKIPRHGSLHTLRVSIVAMDDEKGQRGFILTFDEITELLSAQRKAAWGDVARRIAHEIRNPLTPIQLSAERLKRKYLSQISEGAEKFENCIDTIIRQVTNIGEMVNAFSNFARMPEPKLKPTDIVRLARQSLDQYRSLGHKIEYRLGDSTPKTLLFNCDESQFSQVFTNLLKNATDAVDEHLKQRTDKHLDDTKNSGNGVVEISILQNTESQFVINIDDSGPGFPVDDREQLTEPYITKKEQGTGLGLAIVKKIVEDHAGVLSLEDSPLGGARVKLRLFSDQKDFSNGL